MNIFPRLSIEADRDLVDWSGKKPLDYRKQKTTVSASTYSSEYNSMLPIIHSNIVVETSSFGGTIPKSAKRHQRYATTTCVQRSYSLANADKPDKYNTMPLDDQSDSLSLYGSMRRRNDKRNKSFLRRTLGSAAGRKHAHLFEE